MSSDFAAPTDLATNRLDLVAALAADIGARPAGSDAERRAAETVARAFERAGVASVQLPVRVRVAGPWETLLYAPLGLLVVLVALPRPWAGLALGVLVVVAGAIDVNGRPLLTRWLPRRPGRNVLAIVPPARQEIRRLVVLANLDTVFPVTPARCPAAARLWGSASAVVVFWLNVVVAVLLTLRAVVDGWDRPTLAALLLVAVALLATLAWSGWLTWRPIPTPGAITNASGVAALVDFAGHVRAMPPTWIETWFLAASAGESRGDGARAFLTANSFDSETTYFVQLQSVGAGVLRVAGAEGGAFPREASPQLARLVALASGDKPAVAARPLRPLRRDTQTAVALRRGYDAITLVGTDARGRIPRAGAPSDTPDAVEEARIQGAVGLLIGVLERLDAEAAERNRKARLARHSTPPSRD